MTVKNWTQRVSPRNSPPDLLDMRAAGRDLGQEAQHIPGRTGTVFQNVSQVLILASVMATASLAMVHLWKELCRSHDKAQPHPAPDPSQRQPRRPHTTRVTGPASDDGHSHGRG